MQLRQSSKHWRLLTGGLFAAAVLLAASRPACSAEPGPFTALPDWPKLGSDVQLGQISGLALDSHDRLFVFSRRERTWADAVGRNAGQPIRSAAVLVLDRDTGALRQSWGTNFFWLPHGLTIDQEDNVWLTDVARHQVFKFTPDGRLLLTLGEAGKPGDDEGHFNKPTDVAIAKDGTFFVSDGYGNARVAKFSADGKFLKAWGTHGGAPGQFNTPHGIAIDRAGRVLVADRGNARVQVFDADGKFLAEWKGAALGRPWAIAVATDGSIFIVDGGDQPKSGPDRARVHRVDESGRVRETFGSSGTGAGQFVWPHDVAVASNGAVFIAEVTGMRVQKFVRPVAR
jgi:peptidylamidoglycolate lyase